uniref:AT-hook motif nuclear-localized protein n=1 Tax=Leersia perrieri TaxID=77586 RepID=A0A0D9WDS4_9ORYZ
MAHPHMSRVILFTLLLASSSSCLAQARLMPSRDHGQVNAKESSASKEASPHDFLEAMAPPLPPSPPATDIIHPDSSGWMMQGSVPSPGIGHRV